MAEKKRTGLRRTEKTAVPQNRRRYTEGNLAHCSVEKRNANEIGTTSKAPPNQAKFVHTFKSKNKGSVNGATSDRSKVTNEKQRACRQWFDHVVEMGLRGIRREFIEKIKKYTPPNMSTDAFNDENNINKNRYDDVFLLDKTRIKVRINPEKDEKEKCSEYLPRSTDWTSYGAVQVKILKQTVNVPGTKKVNKTLIQCKFEDREHTLAHILYFGWPDHTVAESVPTCREVRSIVHKLYDKKPIVVHCSAGIGRTGTFVAIEMVCNKLLNEFSGSFDMIDMMQELRSQRMQAVQNDQQYSFIFRCVIEVLIAEEGLSKTSQVTHFIQSYEDMIARKKKQRAQPKSKLV